jgi:hypothetical protein
MVAPQPRVAAASSDSQHHGCPAIARDLPGFVARWAADREAGVSSAAPPAADFPENAGCFVIAHAPRSDWHSIRE